MFREDLIFAKVEKVVKRYVHREILNLFGLSNKYTRIEIDCCNPNKQPTLLVGCVGLKEITKILSDILDSDQLKARFDLCLSEKYVQQRVQVRDLCVCEVRKVACVHAEEDFRQLRNHLHAENIL